MTDQRPNIILIITDQQRFDTIKALGFPYMDTPNLDRLVNEGVTFTNCHISAPSCAPSRASLFTGYYPHTTGILRNADQWRHSWIESLADSGYRCINIGSLRYPSPCERLNRSRCGRSVILIPTKRRLLGVSLTASIATRPTSCRGTVPDSTSRSCTTGRSSTASRRRAIGKRAMTIGIIVTTIT